MRVESSPINPNVDTAQTQASPKATAATAEATASSNVPEATSFAPTSDLVRLLSLVSQSPDVRSDVVDSTSARLNSGEFGTAAAANEAAKNLLDLSSNE
jgi:hypothetical protein